MSFDPLVANAGRLQILTALAVEECQDFVQLREKTQLTDGNLASHARRLRSAGLIMMDKQFREGKPVTSFTLTPHGRKALEAHARRLVAAISHRRRLTPVPVTQPGPKPPTSMPVELAQASATDDDWVD
jgi:DNA-binding MarR family transcriptional regulator